MTLREIEQIDPDTGEVRRTYGYSAPVRVTVPGAPPRTDVGFHAVVENDADGHDTAIKAAVTDGMRRAPRSFGDRFGNGLYGDQPGTGGQPANGGAGGRAVSEDTLAPPLKATIYELGALQVFDADQVRAAVKAKEAQSMTTTRSRPTTLPSSTHKLRTEMGNLYITVTLDDAGRPFEIFGALGKGGSFTTGVTEMACRLISLRLRRGTPIAETVKQIRGISEMAPFPNRLHDGSLITVRGLGDGIAHVLKAYVEDEEEEAVMARAA